MALPPTEAQQLSRQYKDSAAAHILQGRPEEALADYRKVVELTPHDSGARLKVAELLAQLGHPREAVREFHSLALHYAAEGNTLHAIAACKLILAIDPHHAETQENLAGLIAMRGAEERQPPREPEPATPLFSQLPRDVFLALLEVLEMRRVNGGEHIITEGERGHSMFVLVQQGQRSHALHLLLRGRCSVVHQDPEDGERPYPDMTEGALFGEISLLLDLRVTATVRAATSCLLLVLDADTVKERVLSHPEVRRALTHLSRERLDRTAAMLAEGAEIRGSFLI